MRAVIVGSGPSAAGFEPPAGVTVIAVNGAIQWLSRVDHWFTLDPSPANYDRMSNPRPGVQYWAAVPKGTALPSHVMPFERISESSPDLEPDRGTPEWWLWRWGCKLGLALDINKIHTGNSAYGALGLAYHLDAEKVALVGIDATDQPRIEGGRPNNLSHLPLLFKSALDQIDVVSCGHMAGIPQMSIEEGMKWLTS